MVTKLIFPTRIGEIEGGAADIEASEYAKLGPLNRGERSTLIVFGATVLLWLFRPLLAGLEIAACIRWPDCRMRASQWARRWRCSSSRSIARSGCSRATG